MQFYTIHPWCYSPFWALASLIRCLSSSLFAALLLHPLIPSSCSASLWTTSAHLVLALPTGLVVCKFPFRNFFGILSSSILIIWPAHSSLLILMSSTMFGSQFYTVYMETDLHVSGDTFTHHQERIQLVYPSCCWLAAGSSLGEHYQILQIQSRTPDDGRKHRPKHVQLTWNNKLIYIVHLVGYFLNWMLLLNNLHAVYKSNTVLKQSKLSLRGSANQRPAVKRPDKTIHCSRLQQRKHSTKPKECSSENFSTQWT